MENQVEIWKAHPDIAGIEVSSFGRVRTLDKMVWNGSGTWLMKGRILKQQDNSNGYLTVCFSVNGKFINRLVHRLVAQAFISNPDNLPQVNHKDCNTRNNGVENLEWCTPKYNSQYREKYGVSRMEVAGKSVFAINLSTLEVTHFQSQDEAGQALGVFRQNISNVIKGKRKQTGGFWFVNDDGHAVDVVKSKLHDIGGVGLKIK